MSQTLFFSANLPGIGTELYATDVGSGTFRLVTNARNAVIDLSGVSTSPAHTGNAAVLDGNLIYYGWDGGRFGTELMISDGTAAGTRILADINTAGGFSGFAGNFITAGDRVFFSADNGTTGSELWVTDGTTAGTRLVRDITPGPAGTGFLDDFCTATFGNRILFSVENSALGFDLYVSDGTPAGTRKLGTFLGNHPATHPAELREGNMIGNNFYFLGQTDANGTELWVTDGTVVGTRQVTDISSERGTAYEAEVVGNRIYMSANSGNATLGDQLYVSDGTAAGTRMITVAGSGISSGLAPTSLTAFGSRLLFVNNTDADGPEPWITNGTEAGTFRLADIVPGDEGSIGMEDGFHVLGTTGRALFRVDNGTTPTIWVTDGTVAGTQPLKAGVEAVDDSDIHVTGNTGYFVGLDPDDGSYALFVTDGTTAGTRQVQSSVAGADPFTIFNFSLLGVIDSDTGPTAGADTLLGTAGRDTINGLGGNDSISGLAGSDVLSGAAGRDRINGDAGDDRIDGGKGNDRLTGNGGADRFVFAGAFGRDTVTDFALRRDDRIDLSDRDLRFRDLDIRQDGNDALIVIGRNRITLQDIQADDLTAGDFRF